MGAVLVMLLSAAAALPAHRLAVRPQRYVVGVSMAFAIAFLFFWLPVLLGADSSEFSAWSFLFIPLWFLAGATAPAVTIRILEARSVSRAKHS